MDRNLVYVWAIFILTRVIRLSRTLKVKGGLLLTLMFGVVLICLLLRLKLNTCLVRSGLLWLMLFLISIGRVVVILWRLVIMVRGLTCLIGRSGLNPWCLLLRNGALRCGRVLLLIRGGSHMEIALCLLLWCRLWIMRL